MPRSNTIDSKGRVTIPDEIRKRLGVKTGDRVEFIAEGGRVIVRAAQGGENPFLQYKGALQTFASPKKINARVAELRDPEKRSGR